MTGFMTPCSRARLLAALSLLPHLYLSHGDDDLAQGLGECAGPRHLSQTSEGTGREAERCPWAVVPLLTSRLSLCRLWQPRFACC